MRLQIRLKRRMHETRRGIGYGRVKERERSRICMIYLSGARSRNWTKWKLERVV